MTALSRLPAFSATPALPGPTEPPGPRTWVIADDVTGAADSGVSFVRDGRGVPFHLAPAAVHDGEPVVVLDTDARDAGARRARAAMRAAASAVGPDDHVLKKIDSMLRGEIAVELAELRTALPGRPLVVAPAVPALGRTTRRGRVVTPEGGPGTPVASALPPLAVAHLPLADVRAARARGGSPVERALAGGAEALVCDAETPDDLAAIVNAVLAARVPVVWVGAAGLAAALAGRLSPGTPPPVALRHGAPALVVSGSFTAAGLAQARALAASGAQWISFDAAELAGSPAAELADSARAVADRAAGRTTLVSLTGAVDPALATASAAALGRVCADALRGADTAVLTGGATARAVLTAAGATSLRLLGEVEPGVVLSVTGDGRARQILTKSGSFGDSATLVRLATLAAVPPHHGGTDRTPARTAQRDTGPADPGTHVTDAKGTA